MRSSTGKHTQQLDGFQVAREDLIVEGCGVEDLSRLARLSCHRRRIPRTIVHAERTQFRCPTCGSAHVSAYPIRGAFSELSDVYAMKERLRGIYAFARHEYGARLLPEDWCATARLTEVPELESMARTIEGHMEGILGYWRYGKACNSGAEGFNNKVRWLVKQAYGLRDREYSRLKIYALPDTETTRSL